MYKVLDVSRYIINYSNEKDYGISNLKLQKILYFVQAYFLTNTESQTPCFKEKIEAWDFGPVVPDVYHEFKQYGSGDIPTITSYIDYDAEDLWDVKRVECNDDMITEADRKLINAVVDKFADYAATDLVTLTHRQAPWKEAYVPHMNREITIDSIRRYFQ